MTVRNIDRYTRIQGKTASLATAKLAIFGTDILWKSCFKLNLEQLFHTMSIVNITILAVARKNMSIATNYKKSFFTRNNINLCKHNQNSLDIPKSPPGDPIFTGLLMADFRYCWVRYGGGSLYMKECIEECIEI